jgi:hypothetical protein
MPEQTTRFSIAYPSSNQQPFFDTFQSGITEIDSLLFAGFDDRGTVLLGGGSVSWVAGGTNEFSFTEDIKWVSPAFGQVETLSTAVSPVTIPSGNFLTVGLTRGATAPKGLDAGLVVTPSAPIGGSTRVLCWHNPADGSLVFLNGLIIPSGATFSGGATPTASGGNIILDSRGSGATTGSVVAGGTGVVNVAIGKPKGALQFMRVTTAGAATSGRIKIYSDAAKAKLIYEAPAAASPAHNFTTAFVDRTPAYLLADDGTDLESDTLYFSIENTGALSADFTIEMIVVG